MKNTYVRLVIVILVVMALAQFIPEAVNWILAVVVVGMLLVQSSKYSALIAQLKI